jgi:hypothetical protein
MRSLMVVFAGGLRASPAYFLGQAPDRQPFLFLQSQAEGQGHGCSILPSGRQNPFLQVPPQTHLLGVGAGASSVANDA